jgi:hypothetical protein
MVIISPIHSLKILLEVRWLNQYYLFFSLITIPVYHSSEMAYVFGPAGGFGAGPLPPTLLTLSPIIQDYWISFATSLDPNDGKGSTRAFI